jgi:hypothetical protein
MENVGGLIVVPARPSCQECEEDACADAGEGEPVWEPEVLGVEHGQGCEEPAQYRVAYDLDEGVGEEMGDFAVGVVWREACRKP